LLRPSPHEFIEARKMLEKAIELDAGYADAYAALSLSYVLGYIWQWDEVGVLDHAAEMASKAAALDDSNSRAYALRAYITALKGQPDKAISDIQRAVAMNPNDSFGWVLLADINGFLGKPEARLQCAQRGMRLDPRHPEIYLGQEGGAYNQMGRYAEAIDRLKRADRYNPWTHVELAFAYSELGQEQEARAEAAEVFRVSPGFSLEQMKQRIPANWQDSRRQHFLAVLSKAGLK